MSALALLNEDTADTIWYSLNFLMVVLSFALLKKLSIPENIDFKSGLIVYLLTILGSIRLILHNLSGGQTNILMLFSMLLGLYYISKRREAWGACIFALSITIKYTPLIFIPYFILRKKFKLAAISLAAVMAYFILPGLVIGMRTNFTYLKDLLPFLTQSTIFDKITILDPKNQSLLSAIQRLFTNCIEWFHAPPMPFAGLKLGPMPIYTITLIAGILLYLGILIPPKKAYFGANPTRYFNIDYALLFICVTLFNMNAWPANYILLTPGYFIVAYWVVKGHLKDKLLVTLLVGSWLLTIVTLKALIGNDLSNKTLFYSPFTLSGLLIFWALLRLKFAKISPKQERP